MRSWTLTPVLNRLANADQDWPDLVETRPEAPAKKTYEFHRTLGIADEMEGAGDPEGVNVEPACRQWASGLMTTVNTNFADKLSPERS